MTTFSINQRVKHKITGQEMTIKHIRGNVAICDTDEKYYSTYHQEFIFRSAVVQLCNLVVI